MGIASGVDQGSSGDRASGGEVDKEHQGLLIVRVASGGVGSTRGNRAHQDGRLTRDIRTHRQCKKSEVEVIRGRLGASAGGAVASGGTESGVDVIRGDVIRG